MITDDIIEQVEILEAENKALKRSNVELTLQLNRYRESLESAINLMDPDQLRIIHNDLIHFLNINQNA